VGANREDTPNRLLRPQVGYAAVFLYCGLPTLTTLSGCGGGGSSIVEQERPSGTRAADAARMPATLLRPSNPESVDDCGAVTYEFSVQIGPAVEPFPVAYRPKADLGSH